MKIWTLFCVMVLGKSVLGLTVEKTLEVGGKLQVKRDIDLQGGQHMKVQKCDQSQIPVMDHFDFTKFVGDWYELAKSASGHIDVEDGMWKISATNTTTSKLQFLFSGRDQNGHCIKPISGIIRPLNLNEGEITLKYRTFSSDISETIRVLFTDYDTFAVIYTCLHIYDSGECHPAGIFGAIWTRRPHVEVNVYEKAISILKDACIDKHTMRIRNLVGPCKVEDFETKDDSYPAPDFCYQPSNAGTCSGNLQRYYYDTKAKECIGFIYGGCGGNDNNFMILQQCQKQCIERRGSAKEPECMEISKCALHCPPCCTEDKHGCVKCACQDIIVDDFLKCLGTPTQCPTNCEAEEKYSGCYICVCEEIFPQEDGNGVCLEVKHSGQCRNRLERFYYNVIAQTCEKFYYTGCGGNSNNFATLEECHKMCQDNPTIIQRANTVLEIPDAANTMQTNSFMFLLVILWSIILLS